MIDDILYNDLQEDESFFGTHQSLSYSRISQYFMEPLIYKSPPLVPTLS
jgi:hypothetical protein